MQLVLIRHPQPEVAAGICYGKTDIGLRGPASVSAQKISLELLTLGEAPSHMACSPLRRCAELGTALAVLQPNTVFTFDARLQELDFGSWEMRPWDSIGKSKMDTWIASGFDAHHGGESLQALDARVASWLHDVETTSNTDQTRWVVTHAGVIRSILRQKNICSFEESLAYPIDYGHFIHI